MSFLRSVQGVCEGCCPGNRVGVATIAEGLGRQTGASRDGSLVVPRAHQNIVTTWFIHASPTWPTCAEFR